MIYSFLLLVIYIWPFGQLLTFSTPALPFTIYYLDIAVLLVLISLILSPKRKEIFTSQITKPLIIFFGAALISLLINYKQALASGLPLSALYLLRLVAYTSIFFAAKYLGPSRLKKPLFISLGIFSLICLLQYLIFPDMRFLKNLGFDDHYFRLIGSFFDPNFTGVVLAGVALSLIVNNYLWLSLPFIGLLVLTFSRASYLIFIAGLGILLIANKKTKLLLLLIFLGLTIYLVPKPFGEGVNLLRTFSVFSRIESWKQGVVLYSQRPIFGWGYNTLRGIGNSRFQVDNSYIFILATTGIIGLLALINLFSHIYKSTVNQGMKIIALSILFHSLFNNSLFYIWISALFWFVLGLGQKKVKEYKQV